MNFIRFNFHLCNVMRSIHPKLNEIKFLLFSYCNIYNCLLKMFFLSHSPQHSSNFHFFDSSINTAQQEEKIFLRLLSIFSFSWSRGCCDERGVR